ncbi:MAG: transcriptional regulator NrdR [Armatimonadota bacterium]|nr:transcriptional regulator NrdR [Armatimonadota bacterium]MDR7445336.1 transcriptional regulator NrdR [Armatimonadota bacterium]MDR7569817.1 transcriptional regulator NrdR [Armatimonadota bacterium]MDR7614070.1 transcriptional regulator NrdR [Armatimonadota bacterium]
MRCPYCGYEDSRVLDSRPVEEGSAVRRRRECPRCERRFTTYERVEAAPLMVVKRDGRREPFDRGKILAGLLKARGKRPIPIEALEALVADVERVVRHRGEAEVPSSLIGELVMERLRSLDEVAYVRFASEYRRFSDADSIVEEVARLRAQKAREELLRRQIPLLPAPENQSDGRY